jgi:hypothetical protein
MDVDDVWNVAIVFAGGKQHRAAVKGSALRRVGVLAGILAGPIFLVSVGLNTWASVGYLHQLGWEILGRGADSLA